MHQRGQKFETLKQELIRAAMLVGRLTANPIVDPQASAAKKELDRISGELSAAYRHSEAPFRKDDLVRPKLNSSGYVEPLRRLGRDAAVIRRSNPHRVYDLIHHGEGCWSVSFDEDGHRYPAEEFELVPPLDTPNAEHRRRQRVHAA